MPVGSHLDIWDCLASSREIPPPKNNSQKAEEFWDFGVCAVSESLPLKGKHNWMKKGEDFSSSNQLQ